MDVKELRHVIMAFFQNKKDQSGYSATDVRSDDDVWIDDDYIDDDDVPADEDYIDDEYSDDYSDDDYPDESYADDDYSEDDYSEDDYSDEDDVDYEVDEGDVGPFDGDTVPFEDFDFSDFSRGTLSLGSLKIPLPLHSEVQVEMDGNGPRMLHIVTPYGRITPVAFAAPRSEGQWRQTTKELAEGMRNDGLIVHIEHGPWGREIVGLAPEATIRIIGADGPRWMLRMTIAAPNATADQMTELGRDVVARTFVYRGDEPIFAGQPLPVSLPDKLAKKVQQAMEKRQKDKTTPQKLRPIKLRKLLRQQRLLRHLRNKNQCKNARVSSHTAVGNIVVKPIMTTHNASNSSIRNSFDVNTATSCVRTSKSGPGMPILNLRAHRPRRCSRRRQPQPPT